jgi:sulfonate dioxygenase
MAPIATETAPAPAPADELKNLSLKATPTPAGKPAKPQWFSQSGRPESEYPYKALLPIWDFETKYAPLTEFEHVDPGLKAKDLAEPRAFLAGAEVEELTPRFGSSVEGVQLNKLDDAGRQQLALYVAQRGVVAFRDQDFIDEDPQWQVWNWGQFFGRPHIHPVSGHPAGIPEFHLVYRAPKKDGEANYYDAFTTTLNGVRWHSDVTYEKQPPGLTALFLYDSPPSGGDTGYADQREAYRRLSPSFAAYLETLEVLHSGVAQAELGKANNAPPRREPVENIHPLVRRHPVTGEKALYVNRQFSRRIIGLKEEESDAILNLLYDHIERGSDFQIRVNWKPRTVVLWDSECANRGG